jgi:hypothetical protein
VKRGEASRAGVEGEKLYMVSRFTVEETRGAARLSDVDEGSKRPASSNSGVSWKGAPKSSPSTMRGLVKSRAKSSFLKPGVQRKSSKGDSMGEVKYSLCFEESPARRIERIAWAASSSEDGGGCAAVLRAISEVGLVSILRYSEQSEEKASSSVDGVISSNDEVRRVTVRGVGGKKVGMP